MSELRLAVYAADPGLRRLGAAVRASVSFAAVAALLLAGVALFSAPVALAVPGILVAAVASATTGMGFRLRLRFLPLLLLAPAGVAGLALGILVLPEPVLSAVVFFALGVVVVAATLLGRSGTLVALAAAAAFLAPSMVRLGWTDLPWAAIGIAVAAGVSAVLLGVALRERPRLETRRMLASLRALAEQLPLAVAAGEAASRRHLDAVGAAISATRARIAADPDGWPEALRRGDGAALADLGVRLEVAVRDALAGHGSAELGRLVLDPLLQAPADAPVPDSSSPLDAPHAPVAVDWRRAGASLASAGSQLLVAVALALVAARFVDMSHWYWAAVPAVVMVFGTTSATASISRGWRRVLGALAGVIVGFWLGWLLNGDWILLSVVALLGILLQQYVAELAYGVSLFFVAVVVMVLFTQSPGDWIGTLGPRMLLAGCGILLGAGVGYAVLPARLGETLRRRSAEAMAEVSATLEAMGAGARPDDVTRAGRVAYERFDALRQEAGSARRGWPLSRHQRILAEQIGAGAVVARELRAAVHDYRSRVVDTPGYSAAVAQLQAKVTTLRTEIARGPSLRRWVAEPETTAPAHGLVRLERAVDWLAVVLRAG